MKEFKLFVICIVSLLTSACSKEPSVMVNTEMSLLVCSHEWVDFQKGGYYVYSFKPEGTVNISSYNKNGVWKKENKTYIFSGNTLSITNNYGVQEDYIMQKNTYGYMQFQHSKDTLTLYAMHPNNEMLLMLEGQWEKWDPQISRYNNYAFSKNYTYQHDQIIGFRIDEEETGSGNFNIDGMWIEFTGTLKFKAIWYIDPNGDLILQNLSANTISAYHRVNSENESNRPMLAKDSPLFKTLTTGSWILFDQMYKDEKSGKYVQGFEMMTFDDRKCTDIRLFKNKKNYSEPYNNSYTFNPVTNVLEVSFHKYLIEHTSKGTAILKNSVSTLDEKWIHYDDAFVNSLMGKWSSGELIYEFRNNNSYTITVYEDNTYTKVEEVYNGTFIIEPCYITLSPMPTGFMTSENYFHFMPGEDDDTLYLYTPSSTGRITLKRI